MFKREYEQIDFEFDEDFAKYTPKSGEHFTIVTRDGDGVVYIPLTRAQVIEVRDRIDAEVAKFDAYEGPFGDESESEVEIGEPIYVAPEDAE